MAKVKEFNIQAYNKAIAALVVGAIILVLRGLELPVDQSLEDSLGVVITALLVWLVPNKK